MEVGLGEDFLIVRSSQNGPRSLHPVAQGPVWCSRTQQLPAEVTGAGRTSQTTSEDMRPSCHQPCRTLVQREGTSCSVAGATPSGA